MKRANSVAIDEGDGPPPTKSQMVELKRRLADSLDPTRYVIVSPFTRRFCLYYCIGSGHYVMNEIPDEALFKRRTEALAVAEVIGGRRRKGSPRSPQVIAVRKTKKGIRILEEVRSQWGKRLRWKPRLLSRAEQKAQSLKTKITPMLSVRNGAKAVEFYKEAFGAIELFRVDNEAGEVVARLAAEGAEFWVADESPEHLNFSPESLGGGSVRMVMIVAEPDAAFERAVTAGAKVVWPVNNHYGWRLGRLVDPFGHHWEIGKPLSEVG
jgi:PhnB protein